MNLNNLTPWETEGDSKQRDDEKKGARNSAKHRKRISISSVPSTVPLFQETYAKTPTMIQIDSQSREPLVTMKTKRLSLGQTRKRRKSEQHVAFLALVQNEYPIQPETMLEGSPAGQLRLRTKMEGPESERTETLVQSERRCLKLQMMPELQITLNRKRRSTSQLTLRNTHYYYHHKTRKKQSPPKVSNVIEDLMRKLPLKKQTQSSKTKFIEPWAQPQQTIRTMRFDTPPQQAKGMLRPYSRARLDHFLDKLLERMR